MRFLRCSIFLWTACLLFAGNQQPATNAAALNVNTRYTIESVEISGESESRMSHNLRQDLKKLIGEKFNPTALDEIGGRIRKEMHVHVVHRVARGRAPEHVKVVFELSRHNPGFEVNVPKFLYHSKEGWSGAVEGTGSWRTSSLTLGAVSDNDELPERYAGMLARYEQAKFGSNRVRFAFQFATYHQQWNQATLAAIDRSPDMPGIYRTHSRLQPAVTFTLARPLTLTVGTSFDRFQTQFPAARNESANAVITTLRFHQRLEDSGSNQHDWDAGYNLRAATRLLASDFAYARHRWDLRYSLTRGRHVLIDDVMGGIITGRAPLYERFLLGTGSTLRGWNKYDIDPAGGTVMFHNTVEYRYRVFQVFYDTGAVANRADTSDTMLIRHSVGVGLRKSGISLAVAFPVKEGRIEPMFILGMNIN